VAIILSRSHFENRELQASHATTRRRDERRKTFTIQKFTTKIAKTQREPIDYERLSWCAWCLGGEQDLSGFLQPFRKPGNQAFHATTRRRDERRKTFTIQKFTTKIAKTQREPIDYERLSWCAWCLGGEQDLRRRDDATKGEKTWTFQ
jgi:hypothetical protein